MAGLFLRFIPFYLYYQFLKTIKFAVKNTNYGFLITLTIIVNLIYDVISIILFIDKLSFFKNLVVDLTNSENYNIEYLKSFVFSDSEGGSTLKLILPLLFLILLFLSTLTGRILSNYLRAHQLEHSDLDVFSLAKLSGALLAIIPFFRVYYIFRNKKIIKSLNKTIFILLNIFLVFYFATTFSSLFTSVIKLLPGVGIVWALSISNLITVINIPLRFLIAYRLNTLYKYITS